MSMQKGQQGATYRLIGRQPMGWTRRIQFMEMAKRGVMASVTCSIGNRRELYERKPECQKLLPVCDYAHLDAEARGDNKNGARWCAVSC